MIRADRNFHSFADCYARTQDLNQNQCYGVSPVTNAATAILKPRGEDRVRGGHPWVYRSDIADVVDADAGAIVEVRGPRNRLLGHALFSDQSQITIRMISRDETPIDEAFWRARLDAAIRFRDSLQH